jgi:aminopeptidase N
MLPGCGAVVVNAGQSGYYRVLYQPDMVAKLTKEFAALPAIDQLGLLNDNERLSNGDYQPMGVALALTGSVTDQQGPRIIEDALGSFATMYDRFRDDDKRQAQIASHSSRKFGPVLQRMGMQQKAGDSVLNSNLRSSLVSTLGGMGEAAVLAEAKRLFGELDRNPAALDGPLRTSWLGVIAYNADQQDWDKMRKLAQTADSFVVKSALYRLLGAAKDRALAKQALALALTPEPGPILSAGIIGAVASEYPDMATDFALANREAVEALVDVSSRSEYIPGLGSGSTDPAMIGKLEAYAKAHLTPESRKPVDQAITSITTRLKTEPRIKAGIAEWLDAQPAATQTAAK